MSGTASGPLDPNGSYSLATFVYLYFGGDNFPFERMDPNPGETGVVAQTPAPPTANAPAATPPTLRNLRRPCRLALMRTSIG